jgi:hypothetical protein
LNKSILNTGVQSFIDNNINTDIVSVLLKKSNFSDISSKELAQQIESKKKCVKKLPSWFNTSNIYYPKKLNIEQTSSELAAQYKSEIIDGKSIADLTGGFGVDSYYFSKKFKSVFHCEIDTELSTISKHNFEVLKSKNITSIQGDGLEFLKTTTTKFDWLYLDPSRRNSKKGKIFHLSDCNPDITKNLNLLLSKSDKILLKSSPLLDISSGLKPLAYVKEIHIVAIHNEVKELLWLMERGFTDSIQIKAVNINTYETQKFDFELGDEKKAKAKIEKPLSYLYDPNVAILKSGAFKLTGCRFDLNKLHEHTHLYTSDKLIEFPGRCFRINSVTPFSKKCMKKYSGTKINLAVKNFPENAVSIKNRFNIRDGGKTYVFIAKTVQEESVVLDCHKV